MVRIGSSLLGQGLEGQAAREATNVGHVVFRIGAVKEARTKDDESRGVNLV